MGFINNLLQVVGLITLFYAVFMFIIKPNRAFFKLIDNFNSKLPPVQKKAKEGVDELTGFTVMNTTNMDLNLSTEKIDLFQKELELFKYNRIVFRKKEIISYSNNIQRHLTNPAWDKFGIAIIQSIIEDDEQSRPYLFNIKIGKIIGF